MFESGAAPALAFPPNTDSFTMPHTGAVAQLGERRVRNAKVGSSILLRSTIFPSRNIREGPGTLGKKRLPALFCPALPEVIR